MLCSLQISRHRVDKLSTSLPCRTGGVAARLAGPEVRAPAGGPARGGDGLRAARRGARPPRLRPRGGQEVHHAGLQRRDQAETGEQGELKLLQ